MKKFIKLKYKKKNDKGVLVPKEMLINRNTINRVIESKSVVIISTPKFPMGYKNQVIKLDKEDFKHLMEQIC